MKMHVLSGGRLRMRRGLYFADAAREEMMDIPVACILLKHPQGNILFDTGCPPEVASDPQGRWGGLAKVMQPLFAPEDTVDAQLAKAGLEADDIDAVICSHLHPDHCGCNAAFRRATLIAHADELAAARSDTAAGMGYLRGDWDLGNSIDEITGERDLFGDGRIVLVPTPGHTPGMMIARVQLDRDGTFVLASDAAPVREVLDNRHAPRNSWDVDKTIAALDLIGAMQDKGATVIFGHDDAQWNMLRTGANGYG